MREREREAERDRERERERERKRERIKKVKDVCKRHVRRERNQGNITSKAHGGKWEKEDLDLEKG